MLAIPSRRSSGFSLVEVMLSVVIGMITTLAILELVADSEKGKRMIARGADAQTNGLVALQMLQKDVRMSGWSFVGIDLLGCQVALPSGSSVGALGPVIINPAEIPPGDPNTDVLMVAYGNGDSAPLGLNIRGNLAGLANTFEVPDPPIGFAVGHYVIPTAVVPCNNLSMGQVVSTSLLPPNQPPPTPYYVEVDNWQAGFTGGNIYNLGTTPRINVYAVRSGRLTVCDFVGQQCDESSLVGVSSVWQPVIDDVASLRAEYFHADTGTYDQVMPAAGANWLQISAVRFVVVTRARNTKKLTERLNDNDPSNDYDVWLDTDNMVNPRLIWSGNAEVPLDLSADPNWKKYRYQVYETVAALRNTRW